MKVYIHMPNSTEITGFLQRQEAATLSYPEVGQSSDLHFPPGYDHDSNRVYLGRGQADFERAKSLLQSWRMFPDDWTRVVPRTGQQTGSEVAVFFRLFGLWWRNCCRIVYTVDEPGRFGFAYGTLHEHVEMGEERFTTYLDDSGAVWFEIVAFSRPRHWLTRIGYPLARYFQRRFVRHAFEQMSHLMPQSPAHVPTIA